VLSQKRDASAADETQMHHDAFYSYALLILLGGGSKAVVCGQLYVDTSFILPISTTVVNATVHDELQQLHLSSQSATAHIDTSPTAADSQVYPCKEPASLDLQTAARGAYHPGDGWGGFLGLLAGVFAA